MKIMMYCIFKSSKLADELVLSGVGGYPAFVVQTGGLGAAVSSIGEADLIPDVSRIFAYQKVVEKYHQKIMVIPMRYGSTFEDPSAAEGFLRRNSSRFLQALDELGDAVEMGVRILIARPKRAPLHSKAAEADPGALYTARQVLGQGREDLCEKSGRAYLMAKKTHYRELEHLSTQEEAIIERCTSAFEGLYLKAKREDRESEQASAILRERWTDERPKLISLYFLVPRHLVMSFKNAFRALGSSEAARFLLSGPWPPYNLVTDLLAEGEYDTVASGSSR